MARAARSTAPGTDLDGVRMTSSSNQPSNDPGPAITRDSASHSEKPGFPRFILGPHGLRSGWRILLAVAFYACFVYVLEVALASSPSLYVWLKSLYQQGALLTPGTLILGESIRTAAAMLAGLAMSRLESRTFRDYRISWDAATLIRFCQGVPLGFVTLALLMASMHLLGRVSFAGQGTLSTTAVRIGVLYGIGFLLVAFFEEASFRGYLQATLETDAGFWPSAVVLSAIFAVIHSQNPGESALGIFMAGCFGLVAAFSVLRTGGIWFAVGLHAAWDWGQSFVFGVPNSGVMVTGHLLNSSFHGPNWLTGGSVGPEGSIFIFPVLVFWALAIHFMFPARSSAS